LNMASFIQFNKIMTTLCQQQNQGEAEVRSIDTRTWRRMASPLRRTWRALESVEKAVRSSEETNVQLKRGQDQLLKMMNHTLRHSVQVIIRRSLYFQIRRL
jgi:hypothetical protein